MARDDLGEHVTRIPARLSWDAFFSFNLRLVATDNHTPI
jgi:hypothetical protein